MKDTLDLINKEVAALNLDMEKVLKGNAAAGTRARKNVMNIMKAGKQLRKEISEAKK